MQSRLAMRMGVVLLCECSYDVNSEEQSIVTQLCSTAAIEFSVNLVTIDIRFDSLITEHRSLSKTEIEHWLDRSDIYDHVVSSSGIISE